MRAVPLLALTLALAAGGCVLSTSEFAPKSDAECAAQDVRTKACGTRCVRVDDPAYGCATQGSCDPCPVSSTAHVSAAACVAGACGIACEAGWGNCNARSDDGCETRLDSDAAHCGACGHPCGIGLCDGGICSATEVASWPAQLPGPIARDASDGTIRYALVDASVLTTTVGVTSQVCALGGACAPAVPGKATALASDGGTWWAGLVDGDSLLVAQGPPAAAAVVTPVATGTAGFEWVDAIVVTGHGRVLYTTSGAHQDPAGPRSNLHVLLPGGTPTGLSVAATAGAPSGIGGVEPFFFVGTPDSGGTLFRWWDAPTAAELSLATTAALTGARAPTRIAGWSDGSGHAFLFWVSGIDGSVWRAPLGTTDGAVGVPELVAASTGTAIPERLVSDADGVYWSTHGTGRVTEWRASDGAVFHVGYSSAPEGVATDATRVYWTDPTDRKVYRTAK